MLSAQGGVEIEIVAEENPEAIAFLSIDPVRGLDLATSRRWVAEAELDEVAREQAAELLVNSTTATPRVTATSRRLIR